MNLKWLKFDQKKLARLRQASENSPTLWLQMVPLGPRCIVLEIFTAFRIFAVEMSHAETDAKTEGRLTKEYITTSVVCESDVELSSFCFF